MISTPPLIAILTDFGTRDWYVAAMKAVIARLAPAIMTIDISHDIDPGDIRGGSFVLFQCYDDFPPGTTFLCVVDPGVGTDRRPIIIDTKAYRFVGADNGLLDPFLNDQSIAYVLDPKSLPTLSKTSQTFHGRDLFAPAAALLSVGTPARELGKPIARRPRPESSLLQKIETLPASGRLIYFDRFGNAISNIKLPLDLAPHQVRLSRGQPISFGKTFADSPISSPIAYRGSGGLLEIAINQGNARQVLGLSLGDRLRLE